MNDSFDHLAGWDRSAEVPVCWAHGPYCAMQTEVCAPLLLSDPAACVTAEPPLRWYEWALIALGWVGMFVLAIFIVIILNAVL